MTFRAKRVPVERGDLKGGDRENFRNFLSVEPGEEVLSEPMEFGELRNLTPNLPLSATVCIKQSSNVF